MEMFFSGSVRRKYDSAQKDLVQEPNFGAGRQTGKTRSTSNALVPFDYAQQLSEDINECNA